jgi:hypothetical protein
VVLGGSRAAGTERPDSDWDLGLYYRGSAPIDPAGVRALGHPGQVSELGEWGPIVHGGAWLTVDGTAVDVLFRDLDVVERRLADAEQGRYEVLVQNGYVVGAPTYLSAGELATCRPVAGAELPRPAFPERLAAEASRRWSGRATVSLMFAEIHARTGDAVCCAGMLVDATLCGPMRGSASAASGCTTRSASCSAPASTPSSRWSRGRAGRRPSSRSPSPPPATCWASRRSGRAERRGPPGAPR